MDARGPKTDDPAPAQAPNRWLARATILLLLLAIFDVGRVTYCSVRLRWAVEHFIAVPASSSTAAQEAMGQRHRIHATERMRQLSGLDDLADDGVQVRTVKRAPATTRENAPGRVTVTARYPIGLVSPHARAYFGERGLAVGASESFYLASADLADY
jgi:hypothetical protein